MKKYVYTILALSTAGSILSAILLYIHYSPLSGFSMIACSPVLPGSCENISLLPLSSIFGIPIAAFGLIFYLSLCFLILVADYAEGVYLKTAAAAVLFSSLFAVAFDIVLLIILITHREFCSLCAATYIISAAIALISYSWVKKYSAADKLTIPGFYKNLFRDLSENNSDRRAAKSLFVLFFVMLSFSIITTDRNMNIKSAISEKPDAEITDFLNHFYGAEAENPDLPHSSLTLGPDDAPIVVNVFIDFLCSACSRFYNTEKELLKKYRNKIRFVYHHYPLDSECNSSVKNTLFKNACTASEAMYAAASLGIFKEYIDVHFNDYGSYRNNQYTYDIAVNNFKVLKKNSVNDFKKFMASPEAAAEIRSHIEAADRLEIKSTPTIFIASRRIVGIPPIEYMDAIIRKELKK